MLTNDDLEEFLFGHQTEIRTGIAAPGVLCGLTLVDTNPPPPDWNANPLLKALIAALFPSALVIETSATFSIISFAVYV